MQHAIGSRPDPAHGYCVDDVARALQVDLLHARRARLGRRSRRAPGAGSASSPTPSTPPSGRFRNFRSVDGSWIGGLGSDDSYGRAMLALGDTIAAAPDARAGRRRGRSFDRALPAARELTCAARRRRPSSWAARRSVGSTRPERPSPAAHARRCSPPACTSGSVDDATADWPWPEASLTYENALLPRALIVAGRLPRLGRRWSTAACRSLDWLIDVQTAPDGHLSPIGNGWWPRGGDEVAVRPAADRGDRAAPRRRGRLRGDGRPALRGGDGACVRVVPRRATTSALCVADPARGAGCDGLTPDGRQHEPGRRVDADVADRGRAHPGRSRDAGTPPSAARPAARSRWRCRPRVTHSREPLVPARSAANPILTAADVPYPANTVFNPGAARVGDETILLVRVEDLRGISQLHVARSADGVSRLAVRSRAAPAGRRRPRPRGDLGLRGSARSPGCRSARSGRSPTPRTAAAGRSSRWRRPATSGRVRRLGPGHAARGQGRGPVPAPDRRPLGDDPPALAAPRRRPHVAVVLAGPAPLGRPQAAARGPRRRLVGCRQDRPRAAAARDARGLAGHVPRRPRDLRRADLPGRPGAARPRGPGDRAPPVGRVGVRARGALRDHRRRRPGRVPVRLGPRCGERPAAPLLRRRGHVDRPGDGHVQRGHEAGLRRAAEPHAAHRRGPSPAPDRPRRRGRAFPASPRRPPSARSHTAPVQNSTAACS